jgi:hypothetical protein
MLEKLVQVNQFFDDTPKNMNTSTNSAMGMF